MANVLLQLLLLFHISNVIALKRQRPQTSLLGTCQILYFLVSEI